MSFTLAAIESQCTGWGRIDSILLVDPADVASMPTRLASGVISTSMMLNAGATAKTVTPAAYTTSFDTQQQDSDAGDSFTHALNCRISRGRKDVDDMLWRMGESYVHVLFKDVYGVWRWLINAQVQTGRAIPKGLGNRNEYSVAFTAQDVWPAGIVTAEEPIDNLDGTYWAVPDGQAWTDDSGNQWWTD